MNSYEVDLRKHSLRPALIAASSLEPRILILHVRRDDARALLQRVYAAQGPLKTKGHKLMQTMVHQRMAGQDIWVDVSSAFSETCLPSTSLFLLYHQFLPPVALPLVFSFPSDDSAVFEALPHVTCRTQSLQPVDHQTQPFLDLQLSKDQVEIVKAPDTTQVRAFSKIRTYNFTQADLFQKLNPNTFEGNSCPEPAVSLYFARRGIYHEC